MRNYLDFEKPLADLEGRIHAMRGTAGADPAPGVLAEIAKLEQKAGDTLADLYSKLTPWHKTQVARHPDRPHFKEYVEAVITDFTPLAGDRYFAEDEAVIAGFGRFDGQSVAIVGHEKGSDTKTRLKHNFGMARPEGYRKAVRIMDLADRFDIPVVTLVDTAGAYPGVGAEERGQAEAIARSIEKCLNVRVPIVSFIIGEGGSGGAIAIATANRVYMLEHAIYSVSSPEAAASILWRDSTRAKDVALAMRITAQDLHQLGIVDGIVPEPVGGAHRDPAAAIAATAAILRKQLSELASVPRDELRRQRREKFLAIGRNLA
jgi:acetyl-CoA carboxylase carboxyl transferase subunit alpha